MIEKLEAIEQRYNKLNDLLSDPNIIARQSEYQKFAREQSELVQEEKARWDLENKRPPSRAVCEF